MITPRQIKAARSLAGWTTEDLAAKTKLTADTITNIETGRTQAREGSLERIAKAFDEGGVAFTDNEGVRLKSSDIETFIGPDRFHEFTEFVHDHLSRFGGAVCISAVDETLFRKYRKDFDLHRKRMAELVARGDVTVRILATKENIISSWAQYKWQPKQSSVPTAFYVFGNCLALISFAHVPAPYVVLLKSGPFAEAYRHAFEIAWKAAADKPPQHQA
jgi:transcriptional regulator with XRE-family HTH domain